MSQAKDPICGMSVDTERAAAKGVYGAETVYFCSEHCKKTYESRHATSGAMGHLHHM